MSICSLLSSDEHFVYDRIVRVVNGLNFLSLLHFHLNRGMNTGVPVMKNSSMLLSHEYFENYFQVYIIKNILTLPSSGNFETETLL